MTRLQTTHPITYLRYEEVIKKILLGLDTSTTTGIDQIPARFLKDSGSSEVMPLLLRNFQKSYKE